MAFIKVKDKKEKRIRLLHRYDLPNRKTKAGYIVFFSSGNTGAAYYEYNTDEAQKIFATIGTFLE